MCLLSGIENWNRNLPRHLTFDDMNIYIQKDQQNLGAFFFMHLVYNACIFDLTRITLAGYKFPLSAALANAPTEFKAQQQEKCYQHADIVSQILRSALAYGAGSLDDHYTPTAAFESTKVQVIYATTRASGDLKIYNRVVTNINTNMKVLALTHRYQDMPNVYVSAVLLFNVPDYAKAGVVICVMPVPRSIWVPRYCSSMGTIQKHPPVSPSNYPGSRRGYTWQHGSSRPC